jgi:hypothetical protein
MSPTKLLIGQILIVLAGRSGKRLGDGWIGDRPCKNGFGGSGRIVLAQRIVASTPKKAHKSWTNMWDEMWERI